MRLGWKWLDADEELERRHARSIREIFDKEGEAGFREKESAVLAELCLLAGHIVATGGGVVLRPENRDRLRSSGRVVWLTAEPATLAERLLTDRSTPTRRPALSSAASSLDEIVAVLKARERLYRACADLVVSTEGRSPETIADEIAAWWRSQSGGASP